MTAVMGLTKRIVVLKNAKTLPSLNVRRVEDASLSLLYVITTTIVDSGTFQMRKTVRERTAVTR